jgi:hypothetical protein
MSSMAGTRRADLALPAAGVLAATAIGIVVAILDPQLAGATRPHPTLTGSLGDVLWIVQNNGRVLAAPFLLVALGLPQSRLGRGAGDLIVSGLTAASTIPVGLELGRWGARLAPYLPQLPFEWAALALAVHAWVTARPGHVTIRQLTPLAAIVLSLLAGAAALETWATPRRSGHRLDTARETTVWAAAGDAFHPDCAPAAARSLQGRQLSSPRCARFRSAVRPVLPGSRQPTNPHKEGSHEQHQLGQPHRPTHPGPDHHPKHRDDPV